MDINMVSIGKRIKKRRNELRLTQTDIDRECGIKSGALSQIEHGTRTPSVITFYSLSKVLNCSMEWLITGLSNSENDFKIYENEEHLSNTMEHSMELSETGERIVKLCKANRIDEKTLAEIIDVGISDILLVESGIINSPMTIKKIATFFGVDENYLLNGSSSINSNNLSESMFLQFYKLLDNESKSKIMSYLMFLAHEKEI